MGRRLDWTTRARQNVGNGERESIGDSEVHVACGNITKMMGAHVALAIKWQPEFHSTLQMLFEQSTIDRAAAAYGIIDARSDFETYANLAPRVSLNINYKDTGMPTIEAGCLRVQPSATRLLHTIEEIRSIYLKYEQVKYVLRWMNRNATPGAIRHYWPTALALCRTSQPLLKVAGGATRYAEPHGIGSMLQAIRDTAQTAAAAALLPGDAAARLEGHFKLTFHMSADTDQVYVNL